MRMLNKREFARKVRFPHFLAILLLGILFLFITSCAGVEQAPSPNQVNLQGGELSTQDSLSEVAVEERSPEDIPAVWSAGPHASTFVSGDGGKNSDCARCHSPVEFIPSMDDLPESCFTCKFTVDPPPPVIAEEDWSHVACKVCHEVKKGVVNPEVAWLEIAAIGEYSQPASTTGLCLKCHTGSGRADHLDLSLAGTHTELVCTDCHDAHTTQASCFLAGCHAGLAAVDIHGHDDNHAALSCAACHDASGLEVQVNQDGAWSTYRAYDRDGQAGLRPFFSHNIVKVVDCQRCHFPDNPWNLDPAVE
jgi:hypothetical protein